MAVAKLHEEKIKKQAKAIMDEFIKALDKAGQVYGGYMPEPEQATRTAVAKKNEARFRERMLKNAPRKEDDQILAEKKSW